MKELEERVGELEVEVEVVKEENGALPSRLSFTLPTSLPREVWLIEASGLVNTQLDLKAWATPRSLARRRRAATTAKEELPRRRRSRSDSSRSRTRD